jgi:hypothetical protein
MAAMGHEPAPVLASVCLGTAGCEPHPALLAWAPVPTSCGATLHAGRLDAGALAGTLWDAASAKGRFGMFIRGPLGASAV